VKLFAHASARKAFHGGAIFGSSALGSRSALQKIDQSSAEEVAAELLDRFHVVAAKLPLPPEVLERRRAQLRVARRVLDRSVAEPILSVLRMVAGNWAKQQALPGICA
jgi:hypothetical protein